MREGRLGAPIPKSVRIAMLAVALVVGLLSAAFDSSLHGWGLPILAGAVGVGLPVVYYRPQWRHRWFWLVISPIVCLQVPMLMFAKSWVNRLTFVGFMAFAMMDFVLTITAVNWISPTSQEGDKSSN
jgi:hypothetical protein